MLDRDKLETILNRRFPGATNAQVAAAANSIMGLGDEWEELGVKEDFGLYSSSRCADIWALAREAEAGAELRILRRRD
jgi:hypothetical protein